MRISDWSSDVCSSDLLQDLAVQTLYSAGVFNTEYGLEEDDAEDKARRVYAFISLCECALGIILVRKYVLVCCAEIATRIHLKSPFRFFSCCCACVCLQILQSREPQVANPARHRE